MSSLTLPQARSVLSSFVSSSAAAKAAVVTRQNSLATARNALNQLVQSGASQSQLQAQAATIVSLQADLNTAVADVKNLSTSKAAAQAVVNSNASSSITPAVGNPFTAVTGPTGPPGPAGSIAYETVATPNSSTALTSGGAYTALQSVSINSSSTMTIGTSSSPADTTVKALYHFDGTDGATSGSGLTFGTSTITCSNGACLTTSHKRFGSACLDCTVSGSLANIPNPYSGGIPTNGSAFTLEFWFKMKTMVSTSIFMNATPSLQYNNGTSTLSVVNTGPVVTSFSGVSLVTGKWYHVAFSKSSTANDVVYVYLNGVKVGTFTNTAGTNYFWNVNNIGVSQVYLDELRFSVGVDRYPGGKSFAVPTAPFTDTTITPNFPSTSSKGQLWTDGNTLYVCTTGGTGGAGTWKKQTLFPSYLITAPPVAPTRLAMSTSTITTITLTFLNDPVATSNTIVLTPASGSPVTATFSTDSPYTVSGLTPGTTYTIGLTASNTYGTSNVATTTATTSSINSSDKWLWLSFNGSDGSTAFTDLSSYNRSVYKANFVKMSTTAAKFGTACLDYGPSYVNYNEASYLAYYLLSNIGTADFTFSCWVNPRSLGNQAWLFAMGNWDNFLIRLYPSNIRVDVTGQNLSVTQALPVNTWSHLAITRASGTVYLFVDGTLLGSSNSLNGSITQEVAYIRGPWNPSGNNTFDGAIDDLVLIVNQAYWTSSFTKPTSAFNGGSF
jgi:hypothetical protein